MPEKPKPKPIKSGRVAWGDYVGPLRYSEDAKVDLKKNIKKEVEKK
jgi:hypothetical protein